MSALTLKNDLTSARIAAKPSRVQTTLHSTFNVLNSRNQTQANGKFRHKRTHEKEDGAEGSFNLSAEEEEELSGEDQLGSLEEASPTSEHAYVTGSLNSMANQGRQGNLNPPTTIAPTQTFNSLQTLSMPMTISQPSSVNAGGMM
jgi:transcription factor STE12